MKVQTSLCTSATRRRHNCTSAGHKHPTEWLVLRLQCRCSNRSAQSTSAVHCLIWEADLWHQKVFGTAREQKPYEINRQWAAHCCTDFDHKVLQCQGLPSAITEVLTSCYWPLLSHVIPGVRLRHRWDVRRTCGDLGVFIFQCYTWWRTCKRCSYRTVCMPCGTVPVVVSLRTIWKLVLSSTPQPF